MCTNMPFKIYTENKYMGTLSLAIVSINISITIGDVTETLSRTLYVLFSTCVHMMFISGTAQVK